MHEEGRIGMVENLVSQLNELKEQRSADVQTNLNKTERIIGHYIQDLYRFYKLHPRRNEFRDIFTQPFDFYNLPILKRYFSDQKDLLNIAEFYLRKNYFEDALAIYHRLSDHFEEDDMLYQKKGYCHQMTGNYKSALDDYTKAELINPDSKWLLRRIAQCHRAFKKPGKALNYYLRLEKTDPDDLSVLLNIGACLLEMKKYSEALNYYFKVDYLDHGNGRAWRPIAWCLFLMGKYEQAQNYYQKLLLSNPNLQDYLNAGHTEWSLRQLQKAHDHYVRSVQTAKNNFETFRKEFSKDVPVLLAAGIVPEEIPLMLDKVRYTLSN
jgi:tetratricopeptide (TPR) repeat protein